MAARMAEDWEEIAFARDENNETALHVLALNDKMNHGKFLRSLIIKKIQTCSLNFYLFIYGAYKFLVLLRVFHCK